MRRTHSISRSRTVLGDVPIVLPDSAWDGAAASAVVLIDGAPTGRDDQGDQIGSYVRLNHRRVGATESLTMAATSASSEGDASTKPTVGWRVN